MKEEISRHSVPINSDLSHDILGLITKHGGTMSPFMKLFWQQQQINTSRSSKGHRHHPMITRWCLSIASKSAAAYDELRGTFKGTHTLELPNRRTLRDYSNAIRPKTVFSPEIVSYLADLVKDFTSVERFVGILFDGMKVQCSLVFDKSTGNL